jgi:hypothetical protein
MNPLQAFLYKARNDPNFARALQVGGLALLNSGKDESTIRSFARAAGQGMQTLDQGRQRDQEQQTAAADKKWKMEQEERRTKAEEKRTAVAAEAVRREMILRMKDLEGNNAQRKVDAEYKLKSLANQELELRLRRAESGKTTAADREMDQYVQYVKQEAARQGVNLSEPDAFIKAVKYRERLKSGSAPSKGLNAGQIYSGAVGPLVAEAEMSDDPNAIPGAVNRAAELANQAAGVGQTQAVNPDEELRQELAMMKPRVPATTGVGPTREAAAALSQPQAFTDETGAQYTIVAETPAGIILKYQLPDGRKGTIVKSAQEIAPYRKAP